MPSALTAAMTTAANHSYVGRRASGAYSGLLVSRDRESLLKRLRKPLLALWAVYSGLIIAEFVLRAFFVPVTNGATLRPPKTRSEFRPADLGIPVAGVSAFSVNEIGL